MAYKMKGSPVIQGTAKHSALKLGFVKTLIKKGLKKVIKKKAKKTIPPPPVDKTGDFIRQSLKKQLSEPVRKIK